MIFKKIVKPALILICFSIWATLDYAFGYGAKGMGVFVLSIGLIVVSTGEFILDLDSGPWRQVGGVLFNFFISILGEQFIPEYKELLIVSNVFITMMGLLPRLAHDLKRE